MKDNHELLIKIISDKRIELGYSKRALAKMMNVSNSYISKIESFKRNDISLVNLIKICECLELDFINLLVVGMCLFVSLASASLFSCVYLSLQSTSLVQLCL